MVKMVTCSETLLVSLSLVRLAKVTKFCGENASFSRMLLNLAKFLVKTSKCC